MSKYSFPDPKKRSIDKPTDDCNRKKIVKLYSDAHGVECVYLTQEIKDWFRTTALRLGWNSVVFGPNTATLTAKVVLDRTTHAKSTSTDKVVAIHSNRTRPH